MFDSQHSGIELLPGEGDEDSLAADQFAYEVTCRSLADDWPDDGRQALPDLKGLPPGPFLSVLVEFADRSKLNGYDLVRLIQARERQTSHSQAAAMADLMEMAHSTPGDAYSDPGRLAEAFEFAADELRPALTLSRRAADYRLSLASDVVERLPQVLDLLDKGLIDLTRARVFVTGTSHVDETIARAVVAELAEVAPRLTAGQLRARLRKLCINADPDDAAQREKTAHEDRRLVLEPMPEGTADIHLLGVCLQDARAIGRRVNGHMLSLKREDRSGRTHDQLRADIVRDMLLGGEPTNGGRGLVDIHVSASTLDGGSEPAEIGGMGPVTAETARQIVSGQPDAEHQMTLLDENGDPTHIYTLSRRATRRIRRHMEALQPTCSFPGCVAPAVDCDYDHLTPWSDGGETSTTNGGPKCDHDHTLRDHGWTHRRQRDEDIWTSPLGHTYTGRARSP